MKFPHRLEAASKAMIIGGLLAALAAVPAKAATWYVDGASPTCSNLGAGDAATPFCTIQKGASRAAAGDTVLVSPSVYREQVTLRTSGRSGQPITLTATGPGTVVLGSVDISRADKWKTTSTTAWRKTLDFKPQHVFLDGLRLTQVSDLSQVTTRTFYFDAVAMILYVDIGGPNPGIGHAVEASKATYGFSVVGLNNIVIEGFEVRNQNSACVRVVSSSAVTLRKLQVSFGGTYGVRIDSCTRPILVKECNIGESVSNGILVLNSTGVTLKENRSYHNGFHGISLQGSNSNWVYENVSYNNFRWNVRSATGIDVSQDSIGNTIQANSAYGNQDSGIQVYSGSNNNVVVRNASWSNGDHGFDTNASTGTRYISNTSAVNFKDGFSVEGGAINTTFANNIGVNNGTTTREYDLYVDAPSAAGLKANFDIFYKTSPGTAIRVNNRSYTTLTDFRAAGQEANGIDADPLLMGTTSEATDATRLRPADGSPAIDSADSSAAGFVNPDHDGYRAADDPATANTGAGDMLYADRGAFEFDPAPAAALRVTPSVGEINLPVVADASDSTDPDDAPIVSYTFDFGDGTVMGPTTETTCGHLYTVPGFYNVVLSVTDKAGKTSVASQSVLAQDHAPGARLSVSPRTGVIDLPVVADASASRGTEFTPIATYTFDFGDGTIVGPQASPVANHTFRSAGIFHVLLTVTNEAGGTSVSEDVVQVIDNAPIASVGVTPTLGITALTVTADASASSDTDATPIVSYMFDFGDGTIVGPQTTPTAVHIYRKKGFYTVRATVTDVAGLSSTTSVAVKVKKKGHRKH